ncbi:MAG: hypothetical protein GC171_12925 [Terrimonas sp.]|nr:hypothetical protein [Terrimonas sp.]
MKKIIIAISLVLTVYTVLGQITNTGRLENIKDAWNLSYTYTGEIKNGKPNGMGVATYSSGNVIRYVGSFVNGMYSGKGTMLFEDGAFLSGTWANGKLNGKGTNLTDKGVLYIGDFADGHRNGKGVMFYADNSFVSGGFVNDNLKGRCINSWNDYKIISDNIYDNNERNGPGYQYEAESKKLFEGIWKDDKWEQAGTAGFKSFLTAPGFIGESTSTHVLMGRVNASNYLMDSAFYYDVQKKKRYFGYFVNGKLTNGLLVNDSTRFLGTLNDKGANGYCYDFFAGHYYSEGNYTDDHLDGQILDIDLTKKTVYYGQAVNGVFTGKAMHFDNYGNMFSGYYKEGKFTGVGYRLASTGRYVSGTFDDGVVTKLDLLITADGQKIYGNPKTFNEALASVIGTYDNTFTDLLGDYMDDEDVYNKFQFGDAGNLEFSYSLIRIPGSIEDNAVITDYGDMNCYSAIFAIHSDGNKAAAKYSELAKLLQAFSYSDAKTKRTLKLTGKVNTVNLSDKKTVSVFTFPADMEKFTNLKILISCVKDEESGSYSVILSIGEQIE